MSDKKKELVKKRRELLQKIKNLKERIGIEKKRKMASASLEKIKGRARIVAKLETDLSIAQTQLSRIERSLRFRASLKPTRVFRIARKLHKKK